MAYYWITEAQSYIHSLGFGETLRGIDNRPQNVRINQWGLDNSFATDHPKNELRFGKGGVDDAEDAEVILHEYGHAIHFSQNFSFASEEAGAISEGFGDYWAVTVSDVVAHSLGVPEREPLPCVADWDSVSYTSTVPHCLRRVDTNLHYPADLNGEVHHDGQIWSRALWDIRQALGNVKADTIILQGSFDFPGTTMTELANRTVAAAQSLYGTQRRERRHEGVLRPRHPLARDHSLEGAARVFPRAALSSAARSARPRPRRGSPSGRRAAAGNGAPPGRAQGQAVHGPAQEGVLAASPRAQCPLEAGSGVLRADARNPGQRAVERAMDDAQPLAVERVERQLVRQPGREADDALNRLLACNDARDRSAHREADGQYASASSSRRAARASSIHESRCSHHLRRYLSSAKRKP